MSSILFVGTSSWNTDEFISFAQDNEDLNIAYASDYSTNVHTTTMQDEFLDAYHEKYGDDSEPSEATAVAFDAYLMAITAIQNAYDTTMATDAGGAGRGIHDRCSHQRKCGGS